MTGATKLISLLALSIETQWDSLDDRRRKHKLTLFYNMKSNLCPGYLSSLIPPTVGNISCYNLRNANDLQTIKTSSVLYYEVFLPSSVRAWNSLPSEVRQLESLNTFKHFLNKDKVPVPKYYYTGSTKRKVQILHTRLRTRCSSLNLDLFIKNVSDSPMCTCGSIEDTQHYFFLCTNFAQQRVELINEVSTYINLSLNILL